MVLALVLLDSTSLAAPATAVEETIDLDQYPIQLDDIMPNNRKQYDKMRPPKYKGNATEVLFHVTVMSLDTIDESSMTYTCDVFFAQSWKDNRLRLPDNMTSEYRLLPIEWLTEIWRPDSFFKNAKSVTFQTMTIPNHYIWLWKDKTILYMVKLTLVLSCPMHFKNYPHDTQTCNLEIESISHTTDDLVFTWDPQMPLDVNKGIELPQLELIDTKNDDCTTEYSTGKFTCLEVVFKFKRRLGYYLFHTYVPTCLIVIMSWISFWIKPEAVPARVTLGVTSLLTLSTQHANSQKSLPPVSYIKAIDVFMSGCTVFVFLSLMEYALVNIVMGDIADIEKKKSMGISNLILGTRGIPIKRNEKDGALDTDEMLQYGNSGQQGEDRHNRTNSFSNLFALSNPNSATTPPTSTPSQHQQQTQNNGKQPQQSVSANPNGGGGSCVHTRQQQQQQQNRIGDLNVNSLQQQYDNTHRQQKPPQPPTRRDSEHLLFGGGHHHHGGGGGGGGQHKGDGPVAEETVFMGENRYSPPHRHHHHHSHYQSQVPPPPPPPPSSGPPLTGIGGLAAAATVGGSGSGGHVISQQGIKSLVHDVQLKRQKEIRDMMKKKREKAVLVDRISRWLFPTSFILLNIVYWALFGDHDLW